MQNCTTCRLTSRHRARSVSFVFIDTSDEQEALTQVQAKVQLAQTETHLFLQNPREAARLLCDRLRKQGCNVTRRTELALWHALRIASEE